MALSDFIGNSTANKDRLNRKSPVFRLFAQSASWYHALTVTERIESLRARAFRTPKDKIDLELAKRRMRRWCSQIPFSNGTFFEQRLALDSISDNDFLELLGEPIDAVRDRFPRPPAWLEHLAQAYARPMSFDAVQLLQQ